MDKYEKHLEICKRLNKKLENDNIMDEHVLKNAVNSLIVLSELANKPVIGSLEDLANYCIMTLIEMEGLKLDK